MTKEEARKNAEIMLAYAKGAEIEWRRVNDSSEWTYYSDPSFNFGNTEYRVKPEPKYRPYTPEELLRKLTELKAGECFKVWNKRFNREQEILGVSEQVILKADDAIYYKYVFIDYHTLFTHYRLTDGSPCGVEVVE